MQLISDILLGAGALGAGLFCYVLSKRLNAFTTLETGIGGAIAVLSVQVDDMTKALVDAQRSAVLSSNTLTDMTCRAEDSAKRLELLLASLHDLPSAGEVSSRKTRVLHRSSRNTPEVATQ